MHYALCIIMHYSILLKYLHHKYFFSSENIQTTKHVCQLVSTSPNLLINQYQYQDNISIISIISISIGLPNARLHMQDI